MVGGLGAAALVAPRLTPRKYWITGALCAAIPDLDYIGAPFGNRTFELWFGGHRGFTHSIAFAVLLGVMVTWGFFRDSQWDGQRSRLALAFVLATATHGVLDALSTQRPPIAFFSPFSSARYTFPWHPIDPSGASSRRGLAQLPEVLANELFWSGLPAITLALIGAWWRRLSVGKLRG